MTRRPPSEIRAVILFGSAVTGSVDEHSDLDLCLFCDDVPLQRLTELAAGDWIPILLPAPLRGAYRPASAAYYTASTLRDMADRGSLLLWHIKKEGTVLYDPNSFANTLLSDLRPFKDYQQELGTYEQLFKDVEAEAVLTEFDLHILQTIIRDCCIMISFNQGSPEFGRISAYEAAHSLFPHLPVKRETYYDLTSWHLSYLRGAPTESSLPRGIRRAALVTACRDFLLFCREILS